MNASDEKRTLLAPLRILIAGTGGQGTLLAARLLCGHFLRLGHHVVSGQLHGMAQRGGAVQASVIVDGGDCSVIPSAGAHIVIGMEPVETARALPSMSGETIVFMNSAAIVPFTVTQKYVRSKGQASYPGIASLEASIRNVAGKLYSRDASALAESAGSVRSLNFVMLGWLVGVGGLGCKPEELWRSVENLATAKIATYNNLAFEAGVALGTEASGETTIAGRGGSA
jgi:indolepyruvate ferredoxin oxidoreductase beta subunit